MTSLPSKETLAIELKSDRGPLPDAALVEAVVCLANTDGGSVFLGVEDDGRVTGLHQSRRSSVGLPALVANRTSPRVNVTVTDLDEAGVRVVRIDVPKSDQIVATSDGTIKRRVLDARGRPECVPMLPSEIPSRLSDLGRLDASAQLVPGATLDALDPVERARLRQFIQTYAGDRALAELSDDELDAAMGLVTGSGRDRSPTLAGLLLIGREAALRELVPTHEVAFQVLDGETVRLNEFTRWPLLRAFEWLDTLFLPLNTEEEVQVGLFRVAVPRVDRRAFREAIANALAHRDYTRLGTVHVRLDREALTISNPGGFVEGVTQDNLLTTEPRPRNPRLADALKRLGLAERTGRGVDLIYRGLLRYGRARPDYSRSTRASVVLRMPAAEADLGFLRLILEAEERSGGPMPIDSLIALACLREQRRVTAEDVERAIQKDRAAAKGTLERLVEAGLVEPHGNTKGRTYMLASKVYALLDQRTEYTRQAGYTTLQHEQLVLGYVQQHGEIRRENVVDLCHLTGDQASRLLRRLVDGGRLRLEGKKRWARYLLPETNT
ncbi:MAG: ATP-binding protein [Sandaracinus sp.]